MKFGRRMHEALKEFARRFHRAHHLRANFVHMLLLIPPFPLIIVIVAMASLNLTAEVVIVSSISISNRSVCFVIFVVLAR